jgi:hypothetical protein
MFGMLRAAFTLLICLLIVGFYLGWFSFTKSAPDPKSDKLNVNVSVDKQKMGNDLKKLGQNVVQRIEDINSQPQGSAARPTAPNSGAAPGLNIGPITVQPSNSPGQANQPAWSVGPFSVQAPSSPAAPPNGQPGSMAPIPEFQFSVPLGAPPPPGEGR